MMLNEVLDGVVVCSGVGCDGDMVVNEDARTEVEFGRVSLELVLGESLRIHLILCIYIRHDSSLMY